MQTILETYYSFARSKTKLLQAKFFCRWRHCPQNSLYTQLLGKTALLDGIARGVRGKRLHTALSHWRTLGLTDTCARSYNKKLAGSRVTYKAKLGELKKQCEYLTSKKAAYEDELNRYRAQEKGFKAQLSTEGGQLTALKAENRSLKQSLAHKEQQILSYFEELTELVSRMKVK